MRGADTMDIAVIGGGPAGACAAIAAARGGARTVLFERAVFPRPKVCGCCLTARAVAELHALGAGSALDGACTLRSVRVACGGRALSLRREAGVAIGRDALDARLVAVAREAGVAVECGVRAQVTEGGAVRIASDGGGSGAREGVTREVLARTVIVADGLGGTALDGGAKFDAFAWRIDAASHMGFGATVPAGAVACDPGEIRLRVSHAGYIGAVRLPDGSVDIAAAVDPRRMRADGGVAECAIALLGPDARDHDALRATRWKGTPQLTRRRGRVAADGILVVGDAAGYVEPFTGEGMTWAIATGAAAGALAAREREPHRSWPALHARIVGGPRLRCRVIARALRSPALLRAAIALGNLVPAPFERLAASIGREALG